MPVETVYLIRNGRTYRVHFAADGRPVRVEQLVRAGQRRGKPRRGYWRMVKARLCSRDPWDEDENGARAVVANHLWYACAARAARHRRLYA